MPETITYPPSINTNLKKLHANWSWLEQMRLEHNRVGRIANADWGQYQGRWKEYARSYRQEQLPLLEEQNRLRDAIRRANYTDEQWQELSQVQREDADLVMFGDKQVEKLKPTKLTYKGFGRLKAIDLDKLGGQFTDPVENFIADYTEVDTPGWLTVTATKVDAEDAFSTDGGDAYVYKHFGTDRFNGIEWLHEAQIDSTCTGQDTQVISCGIGAANELGSFVTWTENGFASMIGFRVFGVVIHWRFYLIRRNYSGYDYYYHETPDTVFYCTAARTAGGDTVTGSWYSDANRTNLLDTLSVSGFGTVKWRHAYGFVGEKQTAATQTFDGFSQNFDLQYVPRPGFVNFQDPGIV